MKKYYIKIPGFPLPLVENDLLKKRNLHELIINYIALRDSYLHYHRHRSTHYAKDNFKAIYYAKLFILSAYEFCQQVNLQTTPIETQLSSHFDTKYSHNVLERARNAIAHNKERIQELQYNNKINRIKGSAMDGKIKWINKDGVDYIKMNGATMLNIDWFNLEGGTAEGDFWHDCFINDYYFLMDEIGRIEVNLGVATEDFVTKSQRILQNIIDTQQYSANYPDKL